MSTGNLKWAEQILETFGNFVAEYFTDLCIKFGTNHGRLGGVGKLAVVLGCRTLGKMSQKSRFTASVQNLCKGQ